MPTLRIGTRASRLALVQTEKVAANLQNEAGVSVEVVHYQTSGDRIQDRPLQPHLGSSFFTKEIEVALLTDQIDVAVHSCKDLATRLPDGLEITALTCREDPRDVMVVGNKSVLEEGADASIGTLSPRRRGFLGFSRPSLMFADLRGNVPTRVRAVEEGRVDGVILAAAGLLRLNMSGYISQFLEPNELLPAAGQGALAIQCRNNDDVTRKFVQQLDHTPTRVVVEAERACLRRLEAGCQAPVGAFADLEGKSLRLRAGVATPHELVRAEETVNTPWDPETLGQSVAEKLLKQIGASSLLDCEWAGVAPSSVSVEES